MTQSILPRFRVEFRVVLALSQSGELVGNSEEVKQCNTSTNDLNEVFTDLFEEYRHKGLLGLEILTVNPIHTIGKAIAQSPTSLPSIH